MWVNGKLVRLSRIVIAEYLGRELETDEVVHHVDGDTLNDAVLNLQIMRKGEHMRLHNLGNQNALGCHRSEEIREKIRLAKMGNQCALGCHRSEETKEKLRMANLGNQNSLGKHPSEETRAKRSQSIKNWWRRRKERENGI